MRRLLEKIVLGILLLALMAGCTTIQPKTAEAAKIKVVKNLKVKSISSKQYYNKNGQIVKSGGIKYYNCFENKKGTFFYSYPKPDEFGTGPSIKKSLIKGHIFTIAKTQKKAILGKGDKISYSLKVKKGVKILKMGAYIPDELKVTATNKKITLQCKKLSEEKYSDNLCFSVLFSYKGKKYYCEETKSKINYTIKGKETNDEKESKKEDADDSFESNSCSTHTWDVYGFCTRCGLNCIHQWNSTTGKCTICGMECSHNQWDRTTGKCGICGLTCQHSQGWSYNFPYRYFCPICQMDCNHHFNPEEATGKCTICGGKCSHEAGTKEVQRTVESGKTVTDWVCVTCGKVTQAGSVAPDVISREDW